MKNLLFRALIYHVYMDAGVNARLAMLRHIHQRVLDYKDLFGPFVITTSLKCVARGCD